MMRERFSLATIVGFAVWNDPPRKQTRVVRILVHRDMGVRTVPIPAIWYDKSILNIGDIVTIDSVIDDESRVAFPLTEYRMKKLYCFHGGETLWDEIVNIALKRYGIPYEYGNKN